MKSILETIERNPNYEPNFESLEDTFKDMINYCSFAIAWMREDIDGQSTNRDILNRELSTGNLFAKQIKE